MISVEIIANLTLIVIFEGLKLLDIISIKLGFASTLLIMVKMFLLFSLLYCTLSFNRLTKNIPNPPLRLCFIYVSISGSFTLL